MGSPCMTSAARHICTERRNCEGELADQTQPQMAAVLENLIHSAERAAHDKALSNEQLFALALECEKSIELLKVLMTSGGISDAKDGLENAAEETQLRLEEPEAELMRQADRSLKGFIRELAERKQQIACELSSMRLTQRAAKAYHGISGP